MVKDYTDAFELFWRAYPPRWSETRNVWHKDDKPAAFTEWQKLTIEEMQLALFAAPKVERCKWTWDARRWLNHKRWTDEILKEPYRPPPQSEIKAMVDKLAAQYKPPKENIKSVNQQVRELLGKVK